MACGALHGGEIVKRFYASLAILTLVVSGVLLVNIMSGTSSAALRRDCDNNSIIHCGSVTGGELAQRYNENKPGDLPAVYQEYGLNAQEVTHADSMAKLGEVHKDGKVTVGGETVATNAMSIGRQNIFSGSATKSIAGKTYYNTPPSSSFASASIVAYVFFDQNGQFKSAILTSCGNPVSGNPTPKPTPPTPVPPKPKPAKYVCDSLTVTTIDRTNFTFDTKYTVENATFKSIMYVVRDKNGQEIARTATPNYTQTHPGSFTVQAIVTVNVNGQDKIAPGSCKQPFEVTMTPPEECKPGIPVGDVRCNSVPECKPGIPVGDDRCTPCDVPGKEQFPKNSTECVATPVLELPRTGPMGMIGAGLGLSSLIAASYYWYASRRGLLNVLLSQ